MNIYYVYGLIDPTSNVVFYVGKGKCNRMFSHVRAVKAGRVPNGNRHLFNKIQKLISAGVEPTYVLYGDQLTEDAAFSLEEFTIANIGIDNLCNLWSSGKLGRTPSTETLAKKSEKMKGRKTGPRSEETKQKIREKLQGRKRGPVSDDTKKKISEATTGKSKTLSDEDRQRQRDRLNCIKAAPGYRERHSESMKGRVVSEETRKKIGDAHRGKTISDEHKQRLRECRQKNRDEQNNTRSNHNDDCADQ